MYQVRLRDDRRIGRSVTRFGHNFLTQIVGSLEIHMNGGRETPIYRLRVMSTQRKTGRLESKYRFRRLEV